MSLSFDWPFGRTYVVGSFHLLLLGHISSSVHAIATYLCAHTAALERLTRERLQIITSSTGQEREFISQNNRHGQGSEPSIRVEDASMPTEGTAYSAARLL